MRRKVNMIYRAETAGALMKDEFVALTGDMTVDHALDQVRKQVRNKKNIHYVYIIDYMQQLQGVLSIRELLASEAGECLEDIMEREVVSFYPEVDQEEVAKVFRDTDLVTIPVVNSKKQLLGVVQVEDILDVMQEEATEDFHKMAPLTTDIDGGLADASIGLIYRKRIVWLIILVFMNIFSGAGIAHFEDVIASHIALVFFLPLLVDSGGNAGSQSATLVIRALATGDLRLKDWFSMFVKEIVISVLLGVTMALAVSFVGLWRGGIDIAIVVALTMTLIVIVGSLIGLSLPFIFRKLNLDPATASAPLITSIADIVGVLIYFGIASWYLSL